MGCVLNSIGNKSILVLLVLLLVLLVFRLTKVGHIHSRL